MLAPRRLSLAPARSTALTIAAPTYGWNNRDSLAAMNPQDAVSMVNMFPSPTAVQVRLGYSKWLSDLPGQCETIMQYSGSTSNQLQVVAGNAIWDASQGGVASNYVFLDGASGDYASTPDSAAADITGDIEIIAYIRCADYTAGGQQAIVAKLANSSTWSYIFDVTALGMLALITSPTGSSGSLVVAVSTALVPFADGTDGWVRVTFDVNNGASGNTAVFYTSTDSANTAPGNVDWTALGTPVTHSGTTSIFNSTSPVEVGSANAGVADLLNGRVYSAYVYNGIGGTLAVSMVANDAVAGATSWTSVLTGETWTAHNTAVIAGNRVRAGLTNSRLQYVNNTTAGGNYIQAVNGADKMLVYDGTTWHQDGDGSPYDVTGVDSSQCAGITLAHNRVWLTELGTLQAWYGPTGSIGGAFNALDLSSFADRGGFLMGVMDWSIDAGYGLDDMTVFVTSNGQVLIYKGSDPTDASNWGLIGIYWIGSPVGRRFFVKLAGDIALITQDGVVSMAAALQSSRINPKAALSNKIQFAISEAVTQFGNNFGWQLMPFPRQNMLILNVPFSEGSQQQQYVMSTIKRGNGDWAWCSFTGWNANCWELWQDDVYFGANGFVGKAWNTNGDDGQVIQGDTLQAFNAFGNDKVQKRFTMMRPIFQVSGVPAILASMNIDFDVNDNTSPLSFAGSGGSTWDAALWDTGLWGGDSSVLKDWQGCTGIGYWAAPRINTASMGIDIAWMNTTVVFEGGAIL